MKLTDISTTLCFFNSFGFKKKLYKRSIWGLTIVYIIVRLVGEYVNWKEKK